MPKRVGPELGARAVRLVLQHRAEYPTKYRGGAGGVQAGRGRQKSLWRWVAQAEINGGEAPRGTIEENEEIRRLRAENRRLREEAILKAATTFFGELDLCNGGWSPSSTSSVHLTVLTHRVEGRIAGYRAEIRPIPPSATTPCRSPPRAAHPGGLAARVE